MSRRQSRVSIDSRQNDTLLEFENFKKKFLLANKHITKLNSTLSVRIEELNAQISTLYVENLRLRASEIALASQLKREREKSRKVIADAEAATHSLIKQLGHIRKSFNVPHVRSSSPEEPPPARAKRRPTLDANASPAPNRLARPPTVPGICEEDETNASSPEDPDADVEEEEEKSPTPVRRRKPKPRSSDSRLPVPSRIITSAAELPQVDFDEQLSKGGKRKPTRRQSGLLTSMSITTVTPSGFSTEVVPPRPPSPAFGSPLRREAGLAEEEEEAVVVDNVNEEQEVEAVLKSIARREKKERKKEREREKELDKDTGATDDRPRERERKRARNSDESSSTAGSSKSKLKDVTNSQGSQHTLSALGIGDDLERQLTPDHDVRPSASSSHASSSAAARDFLSTPSPKPSSDAQPPHLPTPRTSSPAPPITISETEPIGGRERRVRKSINYAEPKLNTKMRKPDPPPAMTKRLSTSSSDGSSSCRASPDPMPADQLPPSLGVATSAQPVAGVKRKKSRVYVLSEDGEDSEGAQADAEYGGLRGGNGWVNLEGRRRGVQSGSNLRRLEGDETRRHSMAV